MAYVGQPVFFPTWDFAFLKPCLPGQTEQLTLTLVNDSHYDISFVLKDEEEPSKVKAFSILPITFGFTGMMRGPFMKRISLGLLKPFNVDFNAAISGNPLSLIGICLEPYAHKPGELPDKNGIDFLRMWMSHPKRLIDEYPEEESEREKRFDISGPVPAKRSASDTAACDVNFFKDSLVFRQPRPERISDDTPMRRSQILPIMIEGYEKGRYGNFDVMFTPPHDAIDHITTYGFGLAIVQEDHSFHAIQLMSQPFSDSSFTHLLAKTGTPIDFGSTVVMHKKKTFCDNKHWNNRGASDALNKTSICHHAKNLPDRTQSLSGIDRYVLPNGIADVYRQDVDFFEPEALLDPNGWNWGTADLICEKYDQKDIDFGHQREGTVAWLSVYLTNKGTLPLAIKAITADLPELIKIEFMNITSTVPYEGSQGASKVQVSIRKDYWGILRRKLKVFAILNGLTKKHISEKALKGLRRGTAVEEDGIPISVLKSGTISIMEQNIIPVIPQLRPFYSYHFRLGYLNKYQPRKDTDIQFHYMPITTDEESSNLSSISKSMSVHVVGNVYRPLEFFPPFHDFGVAPAESWSASDTLRSSTWQRNDHYGVIRSGHNKETSTFYLQVLNMSMEAQNLSLQFINPEFWVNGRQWHVLPGEKLEVPIEFHPSKEQLQYRGEARFIHNYGTQSIRLSGTGASADLAADDILDFGSLKLGSIGIKSLRLSNRGLLECRYRLEIIQSSTDYRLLNDEPFEHEGVVASGAAELLDVECSCQRDITAKASIVVRWERIPRGVWEEIYIPIAVQIGVPMFRLTSMELDFKTTYINVNKTLEIEIENDGNAACLWSAESKSPLLIIDPENGSIPPGDSIFLEITYVPENYTPLSSEIVFTTDVGVKTLMCYGIVGIPYLMIPEEAMNLNFGISAIDKTHNRPVTFANTSSKPIEYEIVISDLLKDGVPTPPDEFEIFFANPTHGVIAPNSTATINFQAVPKDYNSTVSATFTVRTRDGEQYVGHLTTTGGKAIIKIAPPTVREEIGVRTQTAEMKQVKPISQGKSSTPKISPFETARLAFQSHIENLQDVLAGLRTAEMEITEEQRNRRKKRVGSGDLNERSSASAGKRTARDDTSESAAEPNTGIRKGKSASKVASKRDDEESYKSYGDLVNILSKSSGKLLGNAKALQDTLEKAKSRQGTATEGRPTASRRGTADDSVSSERRQSQKAPKRDIASALTPYEAALLEKAGDEQKKRIASGSRIFDGSDLRSRVKRAADSSRMAGSAAILNRKQDSRDGAKGVDGEARKTASGRIRLPSKPPTALPKISSKEDLINGEEAGAEYDYTEGERQRSAPRTSASARRRKLAITEDHSEIEESTAVRYLDQLSTLEVELEELTGALKNDNELGSSSPVVGIGRYNPGTPRRGIRSSESRKSTKSRTKTRGRQSRKGQEREETPLDDSVFTEIAQEFDAVRRPVEDLMALAQQMVSDTSGSYDPKMQKELLEEINNKIIESTRGVIKAVKDQLSNRWIVNREFLSSALRKVQETTHIMEALSLAEPQSEKLENDFNIGLIRGGDRLEDVLLFNLPNLGNLAFDFEIKEDDLISVRPPDFDSSDKSEPLFVLKPMKGEIQPESGENISASFTAKVSGNYQQGYYVMSGGDRVLSFIVTAKVGNPKIKVEPTFLDFGLVRRGKSEFRTIIISNTGTYKDYWRLEIISAVKVNEEDLLQSTEAAQPAYTLSQLKGELEPGDAFPLNVTFKPPQEGAFDLEFIVHWSAQPILVKLAGVGGGARTKAIYTMDQDVKFNGLDWGICIVGVRYERNFQLWNIGNVEGIFNLSHSNQAMTFDAPRDQNGNMLIAPNSFVPIKMLYTPTQPEVTKESIQVILPDSPVYLIPVRAQSGICEWQITGELILKNMPMTDIQICTITVQNTGGLDIPFDWRLEADDDVKAIMRIVIKELKGPNPQSMMLKPRQTIHVDVTVTPKEHLRVQGSLILSTNLGKGKQSKILPFDFFAYSEQVALDSRKDVSVGRIMVGETAEVLRSLTNFGADKVKYRLRLESLHDVPDIGSSETSLVTDLAPPKGKRGKKSATKPASKTLSSSSDLKRLASPWKLKGLSEGFLSPNETVNIEAIFESINEDGDEWHEARLIVERCDDELHDKWSELSSIKLLGAGGTPKMVLEPEILDFHHFGLGFEKSTAVVMRNEGSAALEYEIQTPWDFDGNIYLSEDVSLTGKLGPQESTEIMLKFRPTEVIVYETLISFKYQARAINSTRNLCRMCSNLAALGFGETSEQIVTVYNDCIFPISVKGEATATDPDTSEEQIESECLSLTPQADRSFAKFHVKLFVPVPLDNSGNGDSAQIAALLARGTKRYTGSQVVPATFKCTTFNLSTMSMTKYRSIMETGNALLLDSDTIKDFDFGEVAMNAAISEKQYRLVPSSGSLSSKGYREFEVFFEPLTVSDDEQDVPSSIAYSGTLKIKCHIPSVPETEISLYGTLIDVGFYMIEYQRLTTFIGNTFIDLTEPIQFGAVKKLFTTEQFIEFRNPVRRQMPYKFYVDKQFADIFQIPNNLVQGIAKPRQLIRIPIQFTPKSGAAYSASAYLETGEGNHIVQLQGRGVEPHIALDKSKVAFGVVGVGAPEFRRVHISNPSDVAVRLGLQSNDNHFLTDMPAELVLQPGETKEIQVIFSPPDMETTRKAEITFLNLDLRPNQKEPEVLGTIELEGVGGTCNFTFGSEDDDTPRPVSGVPTINVSFPKVIVGQKAKKYFEVVNCGDTVVDISIVTADGIEMQDNVELQTDKVFYSITPASAVIQPKMKQKFTVTLRGLKVGEDMLSMQVRTRTLTEAKCIPINVKATVLSPDSLLQDSIRAFARSDNSFEAIIDIMAQEENRFGSERNLWKVLLPVERVAPLLPSMELQYIHAAEPIIDSIDLSAYVIRPPAIPRDLPPRAKKWYMNRVSMALDQGTKSRSGEPRERDALRRQEALNFIRPLEKQVYLEKKNYRPSR
ncbi:hypothetical protein BC829DRAFT_444126 [Chytridium lagenaria]|nr:hypothetical protein BC829DRAFT_444126 [Chytridium lagenaria]